MVKILSRLLQYLIMRHKQNRKLLLNSDLRNRCYELNHIDLFQKKSVTWNVEMLIDGNK